MTEFFHHIVAERLDLAFVAATCYDKIICDHRDLADVVYTLVFQRKKHFMKKGSPLRIFIISDRLPFLFSGLFVFYTFQTVSLFPRYFFHSERIIMSSSANIMIAGILPCRNEVCDYGK